MEWFLIKDREHLGPFSTEALHDLFKQGDFIEDDLVWKDGWSDAKTYKEVFLSEQDSFQPLEPAKTVPAQNESQIIKNEEIPPDLPIQVGAPQADDSTATEDPKPYAEIVQPRAFVQQERSKIMENPLLNETSGIDEAPGEAPSEATEEEEVLDFNEYEFEYEKGEKEILKKIKLIAISLIIGVVGITGYLYLSEKDNVFERPSTMSLGDYDRLKAVAKADASELKFEFALASDKKTLWASTNNPLEGEIFISLESKRGRILGRDVQVKAKGRLRKKLITFNNFQFVKGNRFIDGFYDVEIYTVDDLKVPFFQKMFKPTDKQFRYINEFLITSMLRTDFEKQLVEFSKKQQINSEDFWIEITQKYQTIISITREIRQGFIRVLQGDFRRWDKNLIKFKQDYSSKYGLFFTEFVKSNDASYENLVEKDFDDRIEIIANYSQLTKLSKKVGQEAMRLLAQLETIDIEDLNEKERDELVDKSMMPFDNLIAICERKLAVIKK